MTMPHTPTDTSTLPTVRLRPKANARAMRHGFPWVYANELVTDRRTKALSPGALAVLEDDARVPMGVVAVNPLSKIIARMVDQDPAAVIDQSWFERRIARALRLRETLFDAPYYRLIHAEADGLPGVIIDRFGDTCVIQPNAAWADAFLSTLCNALVAVTGACGRRRHQCRFGRSTGARPRSRRQGDLLRAAAIWQGRRHMSKGDENDPKGLIYEAYRIDGILKSECRTIFLDWALSLPMEKNTGVVLKRLLDQYGGAQPDHPMTEVMMEGLAGMAAPRRRGGWRSRPRN